MIASGQQSQTSCQRFRDIFYHTRFQHKAPHHELKNLHQSLCWTMTFIETWPPLVGSRALLKPAHFYICSYALLSVNHFSVLSSFHHTSYSNGKLARRSRARCASGFACSTSCQWSCGTCKYPLEGCHFLFYPLLSLRAVLILPISVGSIPIQKGLTATTPPVRPMATSTQTVRHSPLPLAAYTRSIAIKRMCSPGSRSSKSIAAASKPAHPSASKKTSAKATLSLALSRKASATSKSSRQSTPLLTT